MSDKCCSGCKRSLPGTPDNFPRNRNSKDGLHCYCKQCHSEKYKAFYAANREQMVDRSVAQVAKRRADRPEYDRALAREGKRRKHADPGAYAAHLQRGREWCKANPEKAKAFKHADRDHRAARTAARNAGKLKATPTWADAARIAQVYEEAKRLTDHSGIKHEVDHIVPLRGKTVCGLHVHNNLRAIPKEENTRKGNRFIPELL